MALHTTIIRGNNKLISRLMWLRRAGPVCCLHGAAVCRRADKEISADPIKFTSSAANIPTKLKPREANKYEALIVFSSLAVFMLYFLYLREENDLDEMLYRPVPMIEEFHLNQVISEMKMKGLDASQAEAQLQELMDQRLAAERQGKEV